MSKLSCENSMKYQGKGHLKAFKENSYDGFINLEGHIREDDVLEGTKCALKYFKDMEAAL